MSMTDPDSHNEVYLERCQEEVDQLLAQQDWVGAQSLIEDMRARGFSHHADILRKALLEAQFVYAEDFRFVPVEEIEPLVLEATWFEGSPKEYKQADATHAENLEQTYRELTETV